MTEAPGPCGYLENCGAVEEGRESRVLRMSWRTKDDVVPTQQAYFSPREPWDQF